MVTDEEIVEIIDQAEAGVGDLLDASRASRRRTSPPCGRRRALRLGPRLARRPHDRCRPGGSS